MRARRRPSTPCSMRTWKSSWASSRVSRTVTFWHWSRGLPAGSEASTTRSLIWPRPSWWSAIVGIESEDFLNDAQDGLGNKGRAVGSLFDATTEHAVEGLGVEPALTQLCFEERGSQHECHPTPLTLFQRREISLDATCF